jgi:putative transposase
MARPRRIVNPQLTHHVIQRGNNRTEMFRAPSDYEVFLYALRDSGQRYEVQIHAYVCMTNHVHVMATPESGAALSDAMKAIGGRYVPYFNDRYGRTGGLFEGRYRSFPIESEAYWLTCLRYVEFNPVRAGLVTKPETYRWSSYAAHAFGEENPLLTPHPLYLALGTTPEERHLAWRAMCGVALSEEELAGIRERVNMRSRRIEVESTHHQGLTPDQGVTGV